MKMFKTNQYFQHVGIIALMVFLSASCNTSKGKRPSPLASDSVQVSGTAIKIVYSSPAVRDRQIWDELVEYNKVWRTGANEATYIKISADIRINGHLLPKGSYSIFTIPTDSTWTIIFNEDWEQWGAYDYDASKDVFRLNVIPEKSEFDERMMFSLDKDQFKFDWENLSYTLKIETQ